MELTDFREARRRIEAKQRHGGDKLTSVEEAARLVKDGDTLAVGGCLFTRTPMALVREVLRQRRQGLTLARNLTCTEGEFLLVAGAAQKIVTSWMSIGLPWGISKILREYAEQGRARFEEWSHMAIGLRFRAGAMGVPFLPTLTMLGSDLMGVTGAKTMACPYTGETLCLVPALFPDVALLHVHRADRLGNCQIDGYPHMDSDIAKAATTVLVTAEEIIPEDETRRRPDRTIIPGFLVDAAIVPGSSGSPVVLKPIIGRKVGENISLEAAPPYLLGIVSASETATLRVEDRIFPTFAGLGIVFDVSTIRETIELFFP